MATSNIADFRFDLDLVDPRTKIGNIKELVNYELDRAAKDRADAAGALMADRRIDYSILEKLTATAARESVFVQVYDLIVRAESDGRDAEELVRKVALRQVLSTHHINSTSNMSVELDLAIKHTWTVVAEKLVDLY